MPVTTHTPHVTPFCGVRGYLFALQTLAAEPYSAQDWNTRCFAALNGEANKELRRVIPIEIRREFGAFFTGTDLSARLLSRGSPFDSHSVFYDPTCGMGDLLLAVAKLLPLGSTVNQTLRLWGHQLAGTDLHSEFVAGAKSRLTLLARQRHGASTTSSALTVDYFPYIRVADGLRERREFERATHLLMNPPFGAVIAPDGCKWARGRVTAAATFVINALERAKPGTEVLAILPDVLRSGSFSEQWRNAVSDLAEVHLVEPYGIFDESADVDVFLLRLLRRHTIADDGSCWMRWPPAVQPVTTKVADFFDVHVGRVVPHRDKKAGPRYPYIHPRCVPTWTVMAEFLETRKHSGQAYLPPFVVVRRTSRPEQAYRAAATVISGKFPVAVENHLIVCQPKDGKLGTCKALMKQLKTETVNEYLNSRIRCRHLTVGAVSDVPFSGTT